jgi:hypothetical protein
MINSAMTQTRTLLPATAGFGAAGSVQVPACLSLRLSAPLNLAICACRTSSGAVSLPARNRDYDLACRLATEIALCKIAALDIGVKQKPRMVSLQICNLASQEF